MVSIVDIYPRKGIKESIEDLIETLWTEAPQRMMPTGYEASLGVKPAFALTLGQARTVEQSICANECTDWHKLSFDLRSPPNNRRRYALLSLIIAVCGHHRSNCNRRRSV
jgi:hypothetical protein